MCHGLGQFVAPRGSIDVGNDLYQGCFYHFSLTWGQALLDDCGLCPVGKVPLGVDVHDEGVAGVVSS